MPAVIERKASGQGTTTSVTLTATPTASQGVLAVVARRDNSNDRNAVVSGGGATWTQIYKHMIGGSTYDQTIEVWKGTGFTSTPTIQQVSAVTAHLTAFHIDGDVNRAVVYRHPNWVSNDGYKIGPTNLVPANSAVIGVIGARWTYPAVVPNVKEPATGWSSVVASGEISGWQQFWTLYRNPTVEETHHLEANDANLPAAVLQIVVDSVPPPSAPTGLTQTGATTTSVSVSWSAVPGASGYEYRVSGGAPVASGTTSATISGLTSSTAYSVEVRAVGTSGTSAWSSPLTATTASPTPPNSPATVTVSDITDSSAMLSWAAPSSGPVPEGYQYRVQSGSTQDVGTSLFVPLTGLFPETAYTYEVRSYASGVYSAWAPVTFSTLSPPPPPPAPGTRCFAPVRGSMVRVTALGSRGEVGDLIQYAVSKSIAKVTVNEIVEASRNEILRNPEEERRLRFHRAPQTIRHTVDIDFLRVDPGVFSLVSGVELVGGAAGDVIGFDSGTRLSVASFALEVWSKLAGDACADGIQRYGYTLFPYLKGGRLSGFTFANGLVSFSLIGAQTRRVPFWGVGPHDLEGPFQRLTSEVSRNGSYRMQIIEGPPPAPECGILEATDRLDNGTAADPMPIPDAPLVVDGGGVDTEAWIIDGGRAL